MNLKGKTTAELEHIKLRLLKANPKNRWIKYIQYQQPIASAFQFALTPDQADVALNRQGKFTRRAVSKIRNRWLHG